MADPRIVGLRNYPNIMIMNIDELSAEFSETIAHEALVKMLPPKLLYRFRAWMRKLRPPAHMPSQKVEQIILDAIDDIYAMKTLAKNEAQASFYDSGIVKMDFGPDVPERVKEAAMKWAKRRGLQAVEASLNKKQGAFNSVIYASSSTASTSGVCVKRMRWTTK